MQQTKNQISSPDLIAGLRNYNLLPAIIFLPARRLCDEMASEAGLKAKKNLDDERREKRQRLFEQYLAQFPEIAKHKHRNQVINAGIASHHAGHLPAWKLLVEKMMSAGLLDAIFATSTVAAGVDFPARTVVISNADRRGNDGWQAIQASELQQMTGRAGRRGKDNVGFVVLVPGRFQNPKRIAELLKASPDPLISRFRATYTSLLNLLDAYRSFSQVREIAEKSFAFRETSHLIVKLEKEKLEKEKFVLKKIEESGLAITFNDAKGFQRLTSARLHLQENATPSRAETRLQWLKENAASGKIVSQGRSKKRLFLILDVHGEKVSAMDEIGQGTVFPLQRINSIYAKKYPLKVDSLETAFFDIHEDKNPPLKMPKISEFKNDNEPATELLNNLIESFQPQDSSEEERRQTVSFFWEVWNECAFFEKTEKTINSLKNEIWLPFAERAKVLDAFGYLDFKNQKVTESGKWLADLRVDKPLLVGEALRHGFFEKLENEQIAGLMAGLVADSERNYGELYLSDKILDILSEFDRISLQIAKVEWENGILPAEDLNYSAIATAEHWAKGLSWEDLVAKTKIEEGDLMRLLSRTGEALLQVASLKKSHPETAQKALLIAENILRNPIR